MKNKVLHNKLAELISQIIEIIENTASNHGLPIYQETDWFSDDGRHYYRRSFRKILWQPVLNELGNIFEKLESYSQAKNIAEEDTIFGSHLNKSVGTLFGSMKITFEVIIHRILIRLLPKNELPKFDLEKFSNIINEIEADFLSPTISTIEITPLFGFRSEEHRISLANDLSIEILSEEEISNLISSGVPMSLQNVSDDMADVLYKYAIVRVSKLTKIFGSDDRSGKETRNQVHITNNTIISALQLFKFGTIFPVANISKNIGFFSIGSSMSSGYPRFGLRSSYLISKNEIEEFLVLWNKIYTLTPEKIPHFLEVAIRRFADGTLRPNLEDQIIDLLISAEAIFLSSSGNKYQGELRYRLAHSAALFLENEPAKQKEIFNFMKNAYDIRSKFVHGSNSEIKFPKKEGGKKMNLHDFESQTRALMRRAIIKVFDLAYNSKETKFSINWDDYIFPNMEKASIPNPMSEI
ncbi:HEPN domain-containing protein [Leptospira santarosai]|uniref:HEPN domain-containing protein n=1 Tax=Leptospira santarosai TaxID=28183 RepID=UPI0022A99649|nr:HEPN domain-containing protein [Leptospira santarosai]UZN08165.1 HEPN domain-containing protein [Leptospira santarosai]